MPNKYGSNIRTFTARNLLWNSSVSPQALYTLQAPSSITLIPGDFTFQLIKDIWGNNSPGFISRDLNSIVNIKRIGIFSNFADGLVFSNNSCRLQLDITTFLLTASESPAFVADFTQGLNVINSTGGAYSYVATQDNLTLADIYKQISHDYGSNTSIISDFAYRTQSIDIQKGAIDSDRVYLPFLPIPALNTMYDYEFSQSFKVPATLIPNTIIPVIEVHLSILGGNSFDILTKTIDTSYNGQALSLDCVMEMEITPLPLSIAP